MSEWISVYDRLPEEYPHRIAFVLVAKENKVVMCSEYNTKTKSFMCNFKPLNHKVTHWMLLPEPPTQE